MTSTQLGSFDSTPVDAERPDETHHEVDMLNAAELRTIELEFAYLHATSIIESHCFQAAKDGAMVFFDTLSAEIDITDEIRYLHSRRLLDVHPDHSHWVSLRDESEPHEVAA